MKRKIQTQVNFKDPEIINLLTHLASDDVKQGKRRAPNMTATLWELLTEEKRRRAGLSGLLVLADYETETTTARKQARKQIAEVKA